MREQKYQVYLTADEQSRVIQSLIRLKNELLEQGNIPMQWMMFSVRCFQPEETYFYLTVYRSKYKRTAYIVF